MDDSRSKGTAVPHARASLVGRDEVVESILGLLTTDGVRIVTVAGISGVGKTAVADEVARRLRSDEPIGVERLRCNDGPADLSAEMDALLGAAPKIGIDVDSRPPAGRTRLVLLDGFERHRDQAGRLARALDEDADLTVLVTSVTPLELRGEHVVRLDPLDVPGPGIERIDQVRRSPAVELLVERIRALDPSFQLDATHAIDAAALCRQLDGLPLALELAAAPCAVTSIREVVRRIGARSPLDVLDRGAVDAADRHRNLRETIAWSVDLLQRDELIAFRRLGVFHGPVSWDDAVALIADGSLDEDRAWDALRGIVARGLAVRGPDRAADRVDMLASVREYAREQLVEHGELDELAVRHARHFSAIADHLSRHLWTTDHAGVRRAIDLDADELAAAAEVLADRGDNAAAIRLIADAHTGWIDRGRAASGRETLLVLLDAADDGEVLDQIAARTAAAELAFWTRSDRDGHGALLAELDEAIDVAIAADRADLALISSATAVQLAISVDDLTTADHAATRALELATAAENTWWSTRFTSWSAAVANQQGRHEDAARLASEALRAAQRHGDDWQVLRTLFVLGGLSGLATPTVSVPPDEAIDLAVALEDIQAECVLRVRAALAALAHAELTESARQLGRAFELARRHGHWYIEEICVAALTLTCIASGRLETAARLHGGLEPALDDLRRRLSPTQYEWYVDAVQAARSDLGAERFDTEIRAGGRLGWRELLRTCDAVVVELQGPASDAANPRGADGPHPHAGSIDAANTPLTDRELQVLEQLAAGRSNKEIATQLGIRPKTVMHHTSSIYRKLAVAGRTEAVSVAWRDGLLRLADRSASPVTGDRTDAVAAP
jgi:predicted ATPase/DNA-binding CsgD family transcriptional regulator